jgi:hypothetical protein
MRYRPPMRGAVRVSTGGVYPECRLGSRDRAGPPTRGTCADSRLAPGLVSQPERPSHP